MSKRKSSYATQTTKRRKVLAVPRPPTKMWMGLRRSTNAEVKSVDIRYNGVTCPSNAAVAASPLYDTAAGSDMFNRVGRKVNLKSLRARCNFYNTANSAGATPSETVRFIIFIDHDFTSGSPPTFADVCQDITASGVAANNFCSNLNLNNRDRFRILRDEYILMPAMNSANGALITGNSSAHTDAQHLIKEFYIPLKGLEIVHSGAGLGAISKGNVFAVGQGSTGNFTCNIQCRVRYVDS